MNPHKHCGYCGTSLEATQSLHHTCTHCHNITYLNPIPVAVVLLPIDDGLMIIRRGIEPERGGFALPGGFIELGETWQDAGARELMEETGIIISPEELKEFKISSVSNNTLIVIFCIAKKRKLSEINFVATEEATEMKIITSPEELAFPAHTEAVEAFFGKSLK
jgi:ADP-ribose pyrophosphatase YjhB (NUDIX family)